MDGECACPPDHPTPCGHTCCLEGASCTNGSCGCPSGRDSCGGECCGEGQICFAGSCRSDVSCGGNTQLTGCPGGGKICCSPSQVCCRDAANGGNIGCQVVGFCE